MKGHSYNLWKSIILSGILIVLIAFLIVQIKDINSPKLSYETTESGFPRLVDLSTGEVFELERTGGGLYRARWTEYVGPLDK